MIATVVLPSRLVGQAVKQKGARHDDLSALIQAALVDYVDLVSRFGERAELALAYLIAHPEMIDDHDDRADD